jgi:hypothetical protein
VSEAFCAAHKVKVGKKHLTFIDKYGATSISFQRGIAHTGHPDLTIMVTQDEPITEKCSLGHQHETGRVQKNWGRMQISWEQAEVLMEWFQCGNWHQIREASRAEKAEMERLREALKEKS